MREEEKKRTSQDSSFKRFMKKRWVFPAIYIASAAIILTAVLWYQSSSNNAAQDEYNYNSQDLAGKKDNPPAIEVNAALENVAMPVKNAESATIQKQFYDVNGSEEEQEAALVSYGNSYQPNTGIDITMGNGETFDVVAALSGTVTKVAEDSLLGNVIVIEHENGVTTQYQSVKDMSVEVGAQVKQGQAIAKAGQSMLNQEAGVHVHFEIRKDNNPVNPISYFNKPVSSVQAEKPAAEDNGAVEEQKNPQGATEPPAKDETDDSGAGSDKDKTQDGDSTDSPSTETQKSTDS